MSMNKVILLGRIGKDIELRKTQSGKDVASFTVACSEKYKDAQGQQQEKTEWVNCTAWGKTAENIARFFGKGSEILLEGKMETTHTEQNGVKTYYTKVVVHEFQFTGGSKTSHSQQQQTGYQQPQQQQQTGYQQQYNAPQMPVQDDMPF